MIQCPTLPMNIVLVVKWISLSPPKASFWVRVPASTPKPSFPRKRESRFQTIFRITFTNWIPAFAGMTTVLSLIACSNLSAAPRSNLLLSHKSKVWRVEASGVAESLGVEFEGGNDVDHQGTSSPVVSPDQTLLAYTKANDLWVMNLADQSSSRLTKYGRAETANTTSVYVLISAWSSDSRQILYYVSHSDEDTLDDSQATLDIPSAPYGYRVYDVLTKTNTAIKFPGEFQIWLPDGSFLLTSAETDLFDQHLLRYHVGEDLPQLVTNLRGWWGQTSVSPDARTLLIAFSQPVPSSKDINMSTDIGDTPQLSSRILKYNLRTANFVNVSPVGFWSEYQMPSYSPSGKRIAYVQQSEMDSAGFVHGKLIIDGKPVIDLPHAPFEYYWIDDNTLTTVEDDTLLVINANTGRELGHTHLAADEPTLTASPK